MTIRVWLAIGFVVVALVVIDVAFLNSPAPNQGDLLLNVGTEIIGIVLTVAVVDFILERRRLLADARDLALRALHEIDHAVWIWQGGSRAFNVPETLALLALVEPGDKPTPATQTMLMELGATAANTLRLDSHLLTLDSRLGDGIAELAPLASIRDPGVNLTEKEIAHRLSNAMAALAAYVGVGAIPLTPAEVRGLRDSSPEGQKWRDIGVRDAENG